jgi:hypothetical protein
MKGDGGEPAEHADDNREREDALALRGEDTQKETQSRQIGPPPSWPPESQPRPESPKTRHQVALIE